MIITADILKKISPVGKNTILGDLEKYLAPTLDKYGINTELRVAHFLAQAAHESAGFKTLQEYATGKAYEGRKDLGNVEKGDGVLFKGRGIFQLTGRANYTEMSKKLGVDLVADPSQAATGQISVLTACEYWNSRKINVLADKDDVTGVTKKINGGTNGLSDRIAYLKKIKPLLPEIFAEPTPVIGASKPSKTEPKPPILAIMKKGDKGTGVRMLQLALVHNGYTIDVDGDFGPQTETAVKTYQKKNGLDGGGLVTAETYNKIMGVNNN